MDLVSGLQSWEHAFEHYPISNTRIIEKDLTTNIARDKEKLRSLVGGNYRALLATAEEIVSLEARTRLTESQISNIGHNCKPLDYASASSSVTTSQVITGQFKLLQRCYSASTKALSAGSFLSCSKLLVISRLLLKSLGDQETPLKPLELLRARVSKLRQKLLHRIDASFTQPQQLLDDAIEIISAYCLVTSSSSIDSIKHFQGLRLEKLRQKLADSSVGRRRILECLQYQLASLRTFKGLLSRGLNDVISSLQKNPILEDKDLRSLETIDLAGLEKIIPQEIQLFIPYFKHGLLSSSEARNWYESWAAEGYQVFSNGLSLHISSERNISDILVLRKEIFLALLPVYYTASVGNDVHEQLREILSVKIQQLCQEQVSKLQQLTTRLLNLQTVNKPTGSLWKSEFVKAPLTNGAEAFLDQIKRRHTGINRRLSQILNLLRSWITNVTTMQNEFISLKSIKWQDIIEEAEDEHEGNVESVAKSLSQDDAQNFSSYLEQGVQEILTKFEDTVLDKINTCIEEQMEIENMVVLIRSIRQSVSLLRQTYPSRTDFQRLNDTLSKMYGLVAKDVALKLSQSAQSRYMSNADTPANKSFPENIPSPQTFSTLRTLSTLLSDTGGTDLWSPIHIKIVKRTVIDAIFIEDSKKLYAHTTFDEAYLQIALGKRAEEIEMTLDRTTVKAAADYWSRTKVLFGLLA